MTTPAIQFGNESLGASARISHAHKTVIILGSDGSNYKIQRAEPFRPANNEVCPVFQVTIGHDPVPNAENASAFDSLIDELENDKESADALADGRKWIAREFYNDKPTLASLRLSAGFSQKQIADMCGIEQPHVSRYESGKHEPSLSTAVCIARALGVDLETFNQAWVNTRAAVQVGRSA